MSSHRIKSLLAAWTLVVLTAVPAFGGHPLGLRDMQAFAPADMSTFGGGYRPNEGFFFSFEGMVFWIHQPNTALIGDSTTREVVITAQSVDPPETVLEFSTHGTGTFDANAEIGQRYEFGFVDGHHGWLFSGFNVGEQNQRIFANDAHVVFDDAPFGSPPRRHLQGFIDPLGLGPLVGDLPVRFDQLTAFNAVKTWGVELNYLYRMHPNHRGGIFELFFGARYLEFDEEFTVEGLEVAAPPFGLGDSTWKTTADNHIVGPQVGARWFRKRSRWTCSAEGRFFAGYNSQSVDQHGQLGDRLDPNLAGSLQIRNMSPTSFSHARHFDEWSPAAELRVDVRYQLTRALSAGVGWTGLWVDNIARPSSMIDYSLGQNTVMGITDYNRQDVFMHAITFVVELNR